jgi:tetratricopeptide (TPR) repeat protein
MKTLSGYLLITLCCACVAPAQTGSAQNTNKIALLFKQVETLYQAGSYQQAVPIAQQLLKACEESFGPENPNTAASLNNRATLYKTTGDYAKAEPLYQRALGIWEKALGAEHPYTAMSLNNLAALYRKMPPTDKAKTPWSQLGRLRESNGLRVSRSLYVDLGWRQCRAAAERLGYVEKQQLCAL